MDGPQQSTIETYVVSGQVTGLTVSEALANASKLCSSQREHEPHWRRVLTRLRSLREELNKSHNPHVAVANLAGILRLVLAFLRKYAAKQFLQRLAATREIADEVRRLHVRIDELFELARVSAGPETTLWEATWDQDTTTQQELLDQRLGANAQSITGGLFGSVLEEVLTKLRNEIGSQQVPHDLTALMEQAHAAAMREVESPVWYIRREDVEFGETFDSWGIASFKNGRWGVKKEEVTLKCLYNDGEEAQEMFLREAGIWHELSHPNVIKMHGACHFGSPVFFVIELARNGSFVDFFKRSDENKSKMWGLFLQAATGLLYLHERQLVHGGITCTNLTVSNDGSAKLWDFGFSYFSAPTLLRTDSVYEQPSSARWKAPECLFREGSAANSTFQSDVYSLGMSIIEARTGEVPWGMQDDDAIMDQLLSEKGYPRPEGVFSDGEWQLVAALTLYDEDARISLPNAINMLKELAEEEIAESEWSPEFERHPTEDIPGITLSIDKRYERLREHINASSNLDRDEKSKLLRCVFRMKLLLEQEQDERQQWEDSTPTSLFCNDCGNINPIDSSYCYNCGEIIDELRNLQEVVFHFVVKGRADLDVALNTFEDLASKVKVQADRKREQEGSECSVCGALHPSERPFCLECGSPVEEKKQLLQNLHFIGLILANEIYRLRRLAQSQANSEQVNVMAASFNEVPPGLTCSRCGEVNAVENVFCSECGTDIEVIRRNKL